MFELSNEEIVNVYGVQNEKKFFDKFYIETIHNNAFYTANLDIDPKGRT